jgi:hypothetical protein
LARLSKDANSPPHRPDFWVSERIAAVAAVKETRAASSMLISAPLGLGDYGEQSVSGSRASLSVSPLWPAAAPGVFHRRQVCQLAALDNCGAIATFVANFCRVDFNGAGYGKP